MLKMPLSCSMCSYYSADKPLHCAVNPNGEAPNCNDFDPVWTATKHKNLSIRQMETKHLFNTIKMVYNYLAPCYNWEPKWHHRQHYEFTIERLNVMMQQVPFLIRELDTRSDLNKECSQIYPYFKRKITEVVYLD